MYARPGSESGHGIRAGNRIQPGETFGGWPMCELPQVS